MFLWVKWFRGKPAVGRQIFSGVVFDDLKPTLEKVLK